MVFSFSFRFHFSRLQKLGNEKKMVVENEQKMVSNADENEKKMVRQIRQGFFVNSLYFTSIWSIFPDSHHPEGHPTMLHGTGATPLAPSLPGQLQVALSRRSERPSGQGQGGPSGQPYENDTKTIWKRKKNGELEPTTHLGWKNWVRSWPPTASSLRHSTGNGSSLPKPPKPYARQPRAIQAWLTNLANLVSKIHQNPIEVSTNGDEPRTRKRKKMVTGHWTTKTK